MDIVNPEKVFSDDVESPRFYLKGTVELLLSHINLKKLPAWKEPSEIFLLYLYDELFFVDTMEM